MWNSFVHRKQSYTTIIKELLNLATLSNLLLALAQITLIFNEICTA